MGTPTPAAVAEGGWLAGSATLGRWPLADWLAGWLGVPSWAGSGNWCILGLWCLVWHLDAVHWLWVIEGQPLF